VEDYAQPVPAGNAETRPGRSSQSCYAVQQALCAPSGHRMLRATAGMRPTWIIANDSHLR
jgi:hypothetical protein